MLQIAHESDVHKSAETAFVGRQPIAFGACYLFAGDHPRVGGFATIAGDAQTFLIPDYGEKKLSRSPSRTMLKPSAVEALAGATQPTQFTQPTSHRATTQPMIGRVDAMRTRRAGSTPRVAMLFANSPKPPCAFSISRIIVCRPETIRVREARESRNSLQA